MILSLQNFKRLPIDLFSLFLVILEIYYYGKTYRHMKVRISEHQGVSPRTGKRVKGTLSTSVRDHMLNCNHTVAWEDFSIIGRESNHYLLETKESLFIKRDNPSLNRNKYSQELFLFEPSQKDNFCIDSMNYDNWFYIRFIMM